MGNHEVDISVTTVLSKQISFEKQDTLRKKYAIGSTSIKVTDRAVQKLLAEVDTSHKERLLKLSEKLVNSTSTCRFTEDTKYPFLLVVDEKSLDNLSKDEIGGIFGVSCIEFDAEHNIGLYFFSYACGLECGHSGFVIYKQDQNQNISILDIIYTGIS